MTKTRLAIGVALASALLAGSVHAAFRTEGASSAQFNAKGPGGLKIEGKVKSVSVADDGTNVTCSIKVADVDTGIALRNKHMREKYVQVAQFPEATLLLPKAALLRPEADKPAKGSVKGTFTLHGVSKEVVVGYDAKLDGNVMVVHGRFDIDVRDHQITIPNYLGVTVDPAMEVVADLRLIDGN